MENIATENLEAEKRGREISQHCLSVPTILRQILEHFSTRELKRLSLVSKPWNYEARSVMRDRGNVIASLYWRVTEDRNQCDKLMAFASDLQKIRIVPFSGIVFHMVHRRDCQTVSHGSLHPSYGVILDRVPWKHFSVRFLDDWDRCKDCPALVLVKNILENHCSVLQELSLGLGNEVFLRTIFLDKSLPCLNILKVENKCKKKYLTNGFIKFMVSRAPYLRELRVEGDCNFTDNILEGSSAVLVPQHAFNPLVDQVCESLIGSFRAKTIEICFQDEDTDPELLNSFIPKLLEASRTSLRCLWMDFLFAIPLMCYGICLENVSGLAIRISHYPLEEVEPSILRLLTGLDFTRVFPNVTRVEIWDYEDLGISSDVISAFLEQGTAMLSRALPNRSTNIDFMEIRMCTSISDFTIALLAQMFPKVKTVQAERQRQGVSFLSLRKHFPCLEQVIINR